MLCKFDNVVLDKRLSNGELRIIQVLVPSEDALGALYSVAIRLSGAERTDVADELKQFCENANCKLESIRKEFIPLRRFSCKEDKGGRIFEVWVEDLISDVQSAMNDICIRHGDLTDVKMLDKNCELIQKAIRG